jgi:hypothetical protein
MNPSAAGWVLKFSSLLENGEAFQKDCSYADHYLQLKRCGFIYGLSVAPAVVFWDRKHNLTKEECTKVNLLFALYGAYFHQHENHAFADAHAAIVAFYGSVNKGKPTFFGKLSKRGALAAQLETMLSARLQETSKILTKNYVSILTYALLYLDVLSFQHWLNYRDGTKAYAKQVESAVISATFMALSSKKNKNKYDRLLLELFESSSAFFQKKSNGPTLETLAQLPYFNESSPLVNRYTLDLCSLAIWDDYEMDAAEYDFLQQLTGALSLTQKDLDRSLADLLEFSDIHQGAILLFEYTHPVKLFYKQSAATVKLLILRNRKRLLLELEESGELLMLLGQSTYRELTTEEKYKVKEQLLDICKTIPSLTIFLLPGGSVLLPLLVKFIPKLLPSAFNENRIDLKSPKKPIR